MYVHKYLPIDQFSSDPNRNPHPVSSKATGRVGTATIARIREYLGTGMLYFAFMRIRILVTVGTYIYSYINDLHAGDAEVASGNVGLDPALHHGVRSYNQVDGTALKSIAVPGSTSVDWLRLGFRQFQTQKSNYFKD